MNTSWVLIPALIVQTSGISLMAAKPFEVLRQGELDEVRKYYQAQFGPSRSEEMLSAAISGRFVNEYVKRMSRFSDFDLLKSTEINDDYRRLSDPNWDGVKVEMERERRNSRWRVFPEKQAAELPPLVSRERAVLGAGLSERVRDILLSSAGSDFHSAKVANALLADYNESSPSWLAPCYAMYELNRNNSQIRDDRAAALGLLHRSIARGGRSSAVLFASLKYEGKHVVKDEAGALALLEPLVDKGTHAAFSLAKILARDVSERQQALVLFSKLASDGTFPYRESANYHAIALSRDFDHAEHLTWLYVAKALARLRLRPSPDWESGALQNSNGSQVPNYKGRRDYYFWYEEAQIELELYESKHGQSTGFMPWRKAYRLVAQERAVGIVDALEKSIIWGNESSPEISDLFTVAHEGSAASQYDIGVNFLKGSAGFPKDVIKARSWFMKSAENGFVPGAYNYALCLAEGVGGGSDAVEAARLFLFGAMRGDALSQHNLGASYGTGRGVDRDYVEAGAWWMLCQDKVPQAKVNLATLAESVGTGVMEKAKVRADVLRVEINAHLDDCKKTLIW
jgi:TPR repeat protein